MRAVIDILLQLRSAHPFCMTLWPRRRRRHTADISRSSDARRKAREQCPRTPPPRIGGPKSEGRKREHLSYNNRRKSHLKLALAPSFAFGHRANPIPRSLSLTEESRVAIDRIIGQTFECGRGKGGSHHVELRPFSRLRAAGWSKDG